MECSFYNFVLVVLRNFLLYHVNIFYLNRKSRLLLSRFIYYNEIIETQSFEQLDQFTDYAPLDREREAEKRTLEKEKKLQQAILKIQQKHGKNALLKGMNLEEGAMTRERNEQIGGHRR